MLGTLTHKNFAMLIFSCSLLPETSASAVSFIAGGPVGISICRMDELKIYLRGCGTLYIAVRTIANHRMGSLSSKLVREAKR